jgi:hypothetical protein
MLRAMDELEKTVNDLLDQIQKQAGPVSGPVKNRSADRDGRGEIREQEAAELVRRAIKRLKSL